MRTQPFLHMTFLQGLRIRLSLAVVLALTCSPLMAASGPFGTDVVKGQFLVVLDPTQLPAQITENLANAGFPTVERLPGLPLRFSHYRLVSIPAANAASKQALLAVPGIKAVRPVYRLGQMPEPYLPNGQVIVKFKPATTMAQVHALAAQYDCTVVRQIVGLSQVYVFDVDERVHDPHTAAQRIKADPGVIYSHASMLIRLERAQEAPILDPLYPFQWHLNNTGQLPGARIGADISAEQAWRITMGAGAVVAVIDDSVQWDHEDLIDNYLTGFDFLDHTGDPSPRYGPLWFWDATGEAHGTAVSGIICARANTVGLRGVAPFASLIGLKMGLGPRWSLDQDVAEAFLFAERNGAMAINNSWSLGGSFLPVVPTASIFLPDVISDAIQEVATNGRGGRGVLVLFASGNQSLPISYGNVYAWLPEVMAIGATQRDDTLTCYSNFGPEQSVVAPGGGVRGPRDHFAYFTNRFCFEADMATTDVMERPGFIPFFPFFPFFFPDMDIDDFPIPGYPVRGYNPRMKFLDIMFFTPIDPNDPFGVPLVPDLAAAPDFPNENYTQRFNGTSAACPVVTGVAALVFSVNPNLTAEQARNLIEHTADKVDVDEWFDPVTGHNERYGHGRVNAHRAVTAAVAGHNWPSPVRDIQNVSSQALVRLFWTNPDTDVAGILVVRAPAGQLNWAPSDGIEYVVGQPVAPNVVVVLTDLDERLDQTNLPTGDFDFALFVRNANNFYSWGRRATFATEDPTVRPLASVRASPTAGTAPLSVHFAGGGIDQFGLVSFHWEFGDGRTAQGPAVDHVYTTGGTYLAKLTVTNAAGHRGSTTVQIVVADEPNILPTASILASPTSGPAPLVVLFQGFGSDPDGVITRYEWDFGDGGVGSGQVVEHTYLRPGNYGAVLTVTDDRGGTGTAVQLITVSSVGATAAATEPEGILRPAPCGAGIFGGSLMAMLSLGGLMFLRRRRGS